MACGEGGGVEKIDHGGILEPWRAPERGHVDEIMRRLSLRGKTTQHHGSQP
jgi:hypothetical protein